MTYKGHSVFKTLIRCRFSPAHSTGQKFIYTGCGTGAIKSEFWIKTRNYTLVVRIGFMPSLSTQLPNIYFSYKRSCLCLKKQDHWSKINIYRYSMETTVDSVTDSSSKIRVHKKLGMILENKVFQILKKKKQKTTKTNLNPNCDPKLLFWLKNIRKIGMIYDIETLEVKFLHSVFQCILKIQQFSLST